MATAENVQAWSKTKASNDGADSAIGESSNDQNPNTLDDQVRSLMASVKKLIEDMHGGLVAAGTNTITVTTNQVLSAGHIADGLMLTFRAVATNTGAVTFNPDSTGAVAVVDQKGNALAAGAIQDNALVMVAYSSHTSKWILLSSPGVQPIANLPTITVAKGGTGAITAAAARASLGISNDLLSSGTLSNDATLDIDISSYTAYRGLKFILSGFHPATDAAVLCIRVSTNGGSTFDNSSSNYGWSTEIVFDSGSGGAPSANTTLIKVVNVGTASTESLNLEVTCLNPFSTAFYTTMSWIGSGINESGFLYRVHGAGARKAADDITDVRFLFDSGNIAAGNYAVYGLL